MPEGLASPVGFSALGAASTTPTTKEVTVNRDEIKRKKAWAFVKAGLQQLPMQLFMMWMSGNTIQIFSIMFLGMTFYNSLKNIASVNSTFEQAIGTLGSDTVMPRLAYVAAQLLSFCVGFYKCSSMGLLPTTTSDWLIFLPPKILLESSFGTVFV